MMAELPEQKIILEILFIKRVLQKLISQIRCQK